MKTFAERGLAGLVLLAQLAIAQQLQRVAVLLAKAGPLLEDLEDLGAIATQLGRLAAGLEAVRQLGAEAAGAKLVLRGTGTFHVQRPRGQGTKPLPPSPTTEPPPAA
jgi:hypothetical protein